MFKPNADQEVIYEEFRNSNCSLTIEAVPGSGKTSTILQLLEFVPPHVKSIFLAFNKSIADELSARVPEGVKVSTIHSIGFRTLMGKMKKKFDVTEFKTFNLGRKYLDLSRFGGDQKKENLHLWLMSKLVDYYRMNMCNSAEDLRQFLNQYSLEVNDEDLLEVELLMKKIDSYNRNHSSGKFMIDYTDMLYLPVKLLKDEGFYKYGVVMVDECQDLNYLQFELVKQLITKRGRLIAVGDSRQAIYMFMGANKSVFDEIKSRPNTKALPLSYCYRCPTSIVEQANQVFNVIKSPEGKEEGEVGVSQFDDIEHGDYVLCRNNLPLVGVYINLLRKGIKCHILGSDYGKDLLNIIGKVKNDNLEEGLVDLQVKKLLTLKENFSSPLSL